MGTRGRGDGLEMEDKSLRGGKQSKRNRCERKWLGEGAVGGGQEKPGETPCQDWAEGQKQGGEKREGVQVLSSVQTNGREWSVDTGQRGGRSLFCLH